jgi:hypothetical protein
VIHDAPGGFDVWRVILLRRNASELLVFRSEAGFLIPEVDIPRNGRIAPALNSRITARWGIDVYSLYPLSVAASDVSVSLTRYHVLEALEYQAVAPPRVCWLPIRDAAQVRFVESCDSAALRTWLDNLARNNSNGHRSPFEKPGWFFALTDWVQDSLRPTNLTLTGRFEQLNASSSFSLIRFETDGAAVWFKAVGEPNEREFPIAVALSNHLSSYVPHVLATYSLWNAWLTYEVPGLRLGQTQSVDAWSHAARDLACMQLASIDKSDRISNCQFRSVRIETLLAQVEPFFACLAKLMNRQTTNQPAPLPEWILRQLAMYTREALCWLQQDEVPDCLGHLDLNPENILALPDRTVFLDWAEGCIGYPFFSLVHLLEHFHRGFKGNLNDEARLIEEYQRVWVTSRSFKNFRQSLSISAFVAIFAHAVSTDPWRNPSTLREPRLAAYYRSLARRMKRYGERLSAGMSDVSEILA